MKVWWLLRNPRTPRVKDSLGKAVFNYIAISAEPEPVTTCVDFGGSGVLRLFRLATCRHAFVHVVFVEHLRGVNDVLLSLESLFVNAIGLRCTFVATSCRQRQFQTVVTCGHDLIASQLDLNSSSTISLLTRLLAVYMGGIQANYNW